MSPTVLRYKKYRLYFFSREESRAHIHVTCPDGEAKFWVEPTIALADYNGLSKRQLLELQTLVMENYEQIIEAWKTHFAT